MYIFKARREVLAWFSRIASSSYLFHLLFLEAHTRLSFMTCQPKWSHVNVSTCEGVWENKQLAYQPLL